MWDLYDDDDISAAEKAAAMAELLRGQRANANMGAAFGNLGLLTGDRVLSGFGKAALGGAESQMADAARREGLLAQAGQFRLQKAMQARENELNRDVRRDELRQRGLDRALQREMYGLSRQEKAQEKQGALDEKAIENLSKRSEAAGGLRKDLETLTTLAKEDDVPGIGRTGFLPSWLLSDKGTQTRQAARGIIGNLIKERSGTAASEKEIGRILEELGMSDKSSDDQFRLGLERLIGQSAEVLQSKESGYRPEVVEEARRRGLTTSKDLPQYRAKDDAAPETQVRGGKTYYRKPNGKWAVKE